MNYIKIFLISILGLLFLQQAIALELDLRYTWQDYIRHNFRIMLESSDWLFLVTGAAETEPLPALTWGIASPWLITGPCLKLGLLRQISGYPRLTVTSGVFRESTGFKLDSGINENRNRLFLCKPAAWLPGIYLTNREQTAWQAGIYFSLPPVSPLLCEVLLNLALPEDAGFIELITAEPAWLKEHTLCHAAGRIGFRSSSLLLQLFGSCSLPAAARPGWLSHLQAAWYNGVLQPGLLLEYGSPHYQTPERQQPANYLKGEIYVGLQPCREFRLDSRYGLALAQVPAQPAAWLPCRQYFSFDISLCLYRQGRLRVDTGFLLKQELLDAAAGVRTRKFTLVCQASLTMAQAGLEIRFQRLKQDAEQPDYSLSSTAFLRRGMAKLNLNLKWLTGAEPACGGSLQLTVNPGQYQFGITLGVEPVTTPGAAGWQQFIQHPADYLNIKLTWQARQQVPAD